MSGWSLTYEGFNPDKEGLREALCTLGNGFFATRGAGEEAVADGSRYPGCYIAGCYNRLTSEVAGKVIENEDLVNAPNWLSLSFRIGDGDWLDLGAVEIISYRQELDLWRGLLVRNYRIRDQAGRITSVASERLVHMSQPHLAALNIALRPENWSGALEIRSGLDGHVENRGVLRYRELESRHLRPCRAGQDRGTVHLVMRTSQSRVRIAEAARHTCFPESGPHAIRPQTLDEPGRIVQHFALSAEKGKTIHFEKIAAVFTSRDHAISEPGLQAGVAVRRAGSFEQLRESHERAWQSLWDLFETEIGLGDGGDEQRVNCILRLHAFHLLQTLSPNTCELDVGVPARGLHGEAYRGHVFWDELFVFPLLNLRIPEITRALLKYRYRRLPEARFAARDAGHDGAMYPWQSGSSGREESQEWHLNPLSGRWLPDHTRLQRHVNLAIAYNVWKYFLATDDLEFLSFYGAEMLFEIARFWASAAVFNSDLDCYEIAGIMGPDEYHDRMPGEERPGLKNNAYTNAMAAWVLWRTAELPGHLPDDQLCRLRAKLRLSDEEFALWDEISRKLRIVFHDDGVISQFEGYEQLAELDWEAYRSRYGNIQRLDRILEAENRSVNDYKVSKQADTLMLFYLFSAEELEALFTRLRYPFDPAIIPRTIEYYISRTSHGSTLSHTVHSWVLSRLDRTRSWFQFDQALEADVADVQGGTTPEGIHLGAMAGTLDIVQRCYTGLDMRDNVLWINPRLPEELRQVRMALRYHQRALRLDIKSNRLRVDVRPGAGPTIRLGIDERIHELGAGESAEFPIRPETGAKQA